MSSLENYFAVLAVDEKDVWSHPQGWGIDDKETDNDTTKFHWGVPEVEMPSPLPDGLAYTENGAIGHTTTTSPGIDLFFKMVRGLSVDQLYTYLQAAWQESPLDTVKIIFHARHSRGGKGERKLFRQCLVWLNLKCPEFVDRNWEHIGNLGRWDDLLVLPQGPVYLAQQLLRDIQALDQGQIQISLAAKWAPSRKSFWDRPPFHAVEAVISHMQFEPRNKRHELYRKTLTRLRRHLNLVESQMCQGQWSTINYNHVPGVAMKLYHRAFARHDAERFHTWTEDLKQRPEKAKIHASQLFPHTVVTSCLESNTYDDILEAQWQSLTDQLKQKGTLSKTVCVADVSGSMKGEPMMVAIALSLMISSVVAPPFQDQIITFSDKPTFFQVPPGRLLDKLKAIQSMEWGMNTNLLAIFTLLLERAKVHQVPPEQMPTKILIFSDMEFDQATHNYGSSKANAWTTIHDTIMNMYESAGYKMPVLVYWNLRSSFTSQFPAQAKSSNALFLSGFSPSVLEAVMEDKEYHPRQVLDSLLSNPKYQGLNLPTDIRTVEKEVYLNQVALWVQDKKPGFSKSLQKAKHSWRQRLAKRPKKKFFY